MPDAPANERNAALEEAAKAAEFYYTKDWIKKDSPSYRIQTIGQCIAQEIRALKG